MMTRGQPPLALTRLLLNVRTRWACPSQKEGDGLQTYQAFVLLYCIIAMNIVVPVTTELRLLQRRGGARKPINALSQSDWCGNVLRRQSCNLIGAARFSAAERMLDRLATRPPLFGTGTPIYVRTAAKCSFAALFSLLQLPIASVLVQS